MKKKNPHAVILGRKGGKSKSPKKIKASLENLKKINGKVLQSRRKKRGFNLLMWVLKR